MAPPAVAPTVTPVGAAHSSLSAISKPVISETVTNTEDTVFGIPKWALAVAAGGVVALGLAYYVLSAPDGNGAKGGKRKKDKSTKTKTSDSTSKTATPSKAKEKEQTKDESKVLVEDVGEEEMPLDPLAKAVACKNKGNKYFRGGRYELAIKSYTEAIETCPKSKETDLSTFYQNRAAAYEQLEKLDSVLSDCNEALRLNNRYVKALERRARVQRKTASSSSSNLIKKIENVKESTGLEESTITQDMVDKLRMALEDMTAVCILEGFQKQEHLMLVDSILKELGRSEARLIFLNRTSTMSSSHFIDQYFTSFESDPIIIKSKDLIISQESLEDLRGLEKALYCLKNKKYEDIIDACNEEIDCEVKISPEVSVDENQSKLNGSNDSEDEGFPADDSQRESPPSSGSGDGAQAVARDIKNDRIVAAKLLRATFYILSKQQDKAFADLEYVIENESADPKMRANALIKRASLYIQRCKDPQEDPLLSFKDFERATEIDPSNADVYHHRGQVHLLTEQIDKAISDFEKALEINPSFPIAYVQKLYTDYRAALEKNDQEQINNVINSFEQAVEKFPECVETYALFAQVLCDQQNFERADSYYERAIKVDPSNANLLVHRGLVMLQWKGDINTARSYIRKALELDDKCEFAYETLGTVEVQSGNLSAAVDLFEKAIPLANTELEMGHICGLKSAAVAQSTVSGRLGISLPSMMSGL